MPVPLSIFRRLTGTAPLGLVRVFSLPEAGEISGKFAERENRITRNV